MESKDLVVLRVSPVLVVNKGSPERQDSRVLPVPKVLPAKGANADPQGHGANGVNRERICDAAKISNYRTLRTRLTRKRTNVNIIFISTFEYSTVVCDVFQKQVIEALEDNGIHVEL